MRKRHIIPGVDPKLLIKDAAKLLPDPARRNFLRGAASLGALTFLTGCDIVDSDAAEGTLFELLNTAVRTDGRMQWSLRSQHDTILLDRGRAVTVTEPKLAIGRSTGARAIPLSSR